MLALLILLIICITFAGCGSKTFDNNFTADYDKQIQISTDIDFGDIAYNMETDSQNYFPYDYRNYAAIPDGYYTFKDNKIYFIEKESLRCMPVCGLPECMHDSLDCNAWLEELTGTIFYYDESLYTVMYEVIDENDSDMSLKTFSLYKISLDGSVRTKLFEIYSSYEEQGAFPIFIIHRGHIYYNYGDKEYVYLVKRSLDGSNPEVIYRDDASTKIIGKLNAYGDGVMFSVGKMTNAYNSKILYYSSKSDEVYEMATGVGGMLVVTEDSIICNDSDNIYKIGIKDLNKEVLVEGSGGNLLMSYDGQYIYVDNVLTLYAYTDEKGNVDYNNHRTYIYCTDGELVDTIDLSEMHNFPDFGDGKYLFFSFNDKSEYKTCVLDKSQIGTGNHEWKEIIFE